MTDRGRVPFALIGVLLLVGSATLAASLQKPRTSQPAVDRALDGITAETDTALREAVKTATRQAARNPVTEPANTTAGRVLSDETPFRDSLKLRIYRRARANLAALDRQRGGIDVAADLPPTDTPAALDRAIERISLEQTGEDGTLLRITVSDVTLTASRGGSVVGRRQFNRSMTVKSPVLAVHDRVERFERRLNAGPARPGLGCRLSARLYPAVWTRGYAQYGGAPIEDVLGNRHVSLFVNGAVLDMQRTAFGRSDPLGRRVLDREALEVGLTDLLRGSNVTTLQLLQQLRTDDGGTRTARQTLDSFEADTSAPGPDDSVTVGVNRTADRAFLAVQKRIPAILERTYAADVRVSAETRRIGHHTRKTGSAGPRWTLQRTDRRHRTTVDDASADGTAAADGYHVLERYGRTVERVTTVERTYRTGNGTETIETVRRTRYAVSLVLEGDHVRGPAPDRPIESVHEPGGPFDGPNLNRTRSRAVDRLVRAAGGADSLAKRAVNGGLDDHTAVVRGDSPAELRAWLSRDLAALRKRVRNVSVTTTRGSIGSFRVNVPAKLENRLSERRTALLDAPDRYESLAHRARNGVRVAFFDAVERRLQNRADSQASGADKLDEALDHTDVDTTRLLARSHRARSRSSPNSEGLSNLEMRVNAAPSYLVRGSVDGSVVPAVGENSEHPLVVRNVNVFGVPFGGGSDGLFGFLSSPDRTNLRAAAQTLATAANATTSEQTVATELRTEVLQATETLRWRARTVLAAAGLGSETSRRTVVRTGLGRWETPAARARALTNGSAADAIYAAAVDRWPDVRPETPVGDRLSVRLDLAIQNELENATVRPTADAVTDAIDTFETAGSASATAGQVAERVTAEARDRAMARARARTLARLPAGLPVVPAPVFWYATVNVWHVEVKGEYARFVVRVSRGTPDRSDASLAYVRDDSQVTLDVDGDGTDERLGRTTRIAFETQTAVGIAVPPGPQGVGDAPGDRDEESAGWPDPGPTG